MAVVPRRFEFALTDEEKIMLRKQNDQTIKKYITKVHPKGDKNLEEQASALLLVDLYYDIGMQDYWIYKEVNKKSQNVGEWLRKRLTTRASESAKLQVLIEDMRLKGYDVDGILSPEIGEIFEYKSQNATSPDILYHGTAEEIDPSQIGSSDENGVYYIRDGISYWTTDYDYATWFSLKVNPEQREKGLMGGNIFSKGIKDGTLCAKIADTHGGAFAMWQDELIKLNQMGVRYIFSAEGRADVLDIKNFTDFVQKRDDCLIKTMEQYGVELPEQTSSLADYIKDIISFENERKKI